jgi:hypothetical protein
VPTPEEISGDELIMPDRAQVDRIAAADGQIRAMPRQIASLREANAVLARDARWGGDGAEAHEGK